MNILVTGATGYLGSHLLRHLVQQGHKAVIIKRNTSDTRRIADLLSSIAVFALERLDFDQPFRAIGNIDMVIHMATAYGRQKEHSSALCESNTLFPLKLLEATVRFKTASFVNTDTSLPKNISSYALSKRHFAEWGALFGQRQQIRFVNIAVEHFYGPGDDDIKFPAHVIRSCLRNVPDLQLTLGEQKRDFIHIDDVVAAYAVIIDSEAARRPSVRNYSVGTGHSLRIRDFVEMAHRLTGSRTRLNFGAIPYRENEPMEATIDLSALARLGWKPKLTLEEGLRRTIEQERARTT